MSEVMEASQRSQRFWKYRAPWKVPMNGTLLLVWAALVLFDGSNFWWAIPMGIMSLVSLASEFVWWEIRDGQLVQVYLGMTTRIPLESITRIKLEGTFLFSGEVVNVWYLRDGSAYDPEAEIEAETAKAAVGFMSIEAKEMADFVDLLRPLIPQADFEF